MSIQPVCLRNKVNILVTMQQQLKKFKAAFTITPIIISTLTKYNKHSAPQIDDLIESYHSSRWIQFQDNMQYTKSEQYLKRFYKYNEYQNKIKLLGDYYRFHFEAPRIFMAGIARIIEINVEDKRELQFALVTKQMHHKDNNSADEQYLVINTNRIMHNHEKLIKDVELSYEDFELRPHKNAPAPKAKIHVNQQAGNRKTDKMHQQISVKTMTRVDSIKFKGSFLVFKPKAQNIQEPQNIRQKIQLKYKKPKNSRKSKNKVEEAKKSGTQKTKNMSKVTSANNSMASHQGLSRSKSRTQLNTIKSKKFTQCKQSQTKESRPGSNNPSLQNSMTKSLSKKQILGDKNSTNTLLKKGQVIDLKPERKNSMKKQGSKDNRENQSGKIGPLSRKGSQNQVGGEKKMFNRALQIKKKK